ncbi:MAG TPA: PaaI family thioesterase [Kineosporiaceae bacterium]|nr:PaaI family thioesterase [Kineosporiaceae bacterium]
MDNPVDDASDAQVGSSTAALALRDQRKAIRELGEALRTLVEQAAATEASPEVLRQAAAQIRAATAPLGERQRKREEMPSADDLLGGIRMYNPVCGVGSALAPPLRVEMVDGTAVGTCTLGLAFEGPPTLAHGGVSALLLDQLLGHVSGASGHPGMTVSLHTNYRAPVPLQTPLRLSARVVEVNGRKVTAHGVIATAADPDTVLVEATGIFVALALHQARRLFGAALRPDEVDPAVAHD